MYDFFMYNTSNTLENNKKHGKLLPIVFMD